MTGRFALWALSWIAACVLIACIFGCSGSQPPRYYSVSSDFSGAERETIHSAVGAWCDSKAHSCPELTLWSERGRFELVDDLPESEQTLRDCPKGRKCTVSGNNNGTTVEIARNRMSPEDLGFLWDIAAHEWGHFCIDGHLVDGLMSAVHRDEEGVLEVDENASLAWHAGCGS